MFVSIHHDGIAFFLRDGHWADFAGQVPIANGGRSSQLAVVGHQVLRFAFDLEIHRHVLGRFRHGVHTVLRLHEFVHKTPADGGVIDRVAAREGALGLGHHKGCAAHAFDSTGNHQSSLTGFDGASCRAHRIQPRAAQTVECAAGHFLRQTCQQCAHARHVAVVFAGLVGAAVEHVGDRGPIHLRVARHQGCNRHCAQIVSTYARQRTAVATERGANGVANQSLVHVCLAINRGEAQNMHYVAYFRFFIINRPIGREL